jgi:hypothetical protein
MYSPALASDLGLALNAHPQLTEREYQLVAEQNRKQAQLRSQKRQVRLAQVREKLERARQQADAAHVAELEGVLARLEQNPALRSEDERWSAAHGRRMTMKAWWAKYGPRLHAPEVVGEFDRHAWREARLQRMLVVAEQLPDPAQRERLQGEVRLTISAESERNHAALTRWLGEWSPPQPPSGHAVPSPTPRVGGPTP